MKNNNIPSRYIQSKLNVKEEENSIKLEENKQ